MPDFVIEKEQAGRRLDRVVRAFAPGMPPGLIQRALRTGQIRLNGKKAEASFRPAEGDALTIQADDSFFHPAEKPDRFLANFRPRLRVIYEDKNVLLVDKRPGLICHGDENEKVNTLINHVRAYLYQKDERAEEASLCNRIDRFTGGIVIAAKHKEALKDMDQRIRAGKVKKFYLCLIRGGMRPEEGVLDNWLCQNPGEKSVRVLDRPVEGAKRALTAYRTLESRDGLSMMECQLLTGRTHQIRAQFAHAGRPLLGDGQYGRVENGREYQALYAWRVSFEENGGLLDYLAGRSFRVREVPFLREYSME